MRKGGEGRGQQIGKGKQAAIAFAAAAAVVVAAAAVGDSASPGSPGSCQPSTLVTLSLGYHLSQMITT